MRHQWQLDLVHVSGRRKNCTDLEIDVKLLLSVEGAGYIWGITVVLQENDFLPVLLNCLVIFYFLYTHNLSNSWISYS